ncbi:MAG: hypothetical protein WA137_11375 [Methanothrix sp.]
MIAIIITAGVAYAVKSPISPRDAQATKLKPDIVVSDIQITPLGETSEGQSVRITATLTNMAIGTSTGQFKVRVDRLFPVSWNMSLWNTMQFGGVANLINDPSKASLPRVTLYFDDVIQPRYTHAKYQVVADSRYEVVEANESNNILESEYFVG